MDRLPEVARQVRTIQTTVLMNKCVSYCGDRQVADEASGFPRSQRGHLHRDNWCEQDLCGSTRGFLTVRWGEVPSHSRTEGGKASGGRLRRRGAGHV